MTTNLISQLNREFSGDVVNKISASLGEDSRKIQDSLEGALPALVSGLVNKASTNQGASDLLDLLKRNDFDGTRFTNAASAIAGTDGISRLIEAGSPLLNSFFGSRTNSVIDWVTSLGGIRRTSASSLLSLAVPIVLGQLGRMVSSTGWSTSNLMKLLSDQKNYLHNVPSGLYNALGYGATTSTTREREYISEPRRQESSWWKWALPLLLLLALIPLLGRLFSGREEQIQTRVVPTATPTARAEATPTITPMRAELGAFIDKRLPDGLTIRIPSNGVENKLIAFIEDPSRGVDKETWYSFDRLEFETDSATLKPTSEEQLRNIAAIMKSYPNVTIKIGGYTDNVGNDSYNLKLSQDRANNVKNELVRYGINENRISAEGYGEQHPIADNSTEEGRQRNRRIDVRVTKK
jgi:OmpA-OmpF porin, OOP family